jgi:HEAT repeat protein
MKRDKRIVVNAVRTIGSEAVPLLIPALANLDGEVRKAVAQALCKYPEMTPTLIPALQSALSTERDDEVRTAIQIAITDLIGKPTTSRADDL